MAEPLIKAEQADELRRVLTAALEETVEEISKKNAESKNQAVALMMTLSMGIGASMLRERVAKKLLGELNYALTKKG